MNFEEKVKRVEGLTTDDQLRGSSIISRLADGDWSCREGKLAGVLVWCAAAWHLKDRDEAVGWDAVTRS